VGSLPPDRRGPAENRRGPSADCNVIVDRWRGIRRIFAILEQALSERLPLHPHFALGGISVRTARHRNGTISAVRSRDSWYG
jgi:hypothetical protein